jgi:hypothetical protein
MPIFVDGLLLRDETTSLITNLVGNDSTKENSMFPSLDCTDDVSIDDD